MTTAAKGQPIYIYMQGQQKLYITLTWPSVCMNTKQILQQYTTITTYSLPIHSVTHHPPVWVFSISYLSRVEGDTI